MSRSHCKKACRRCPFRKNTDSEKLSVEEVKKMNALPSKPCDHNSHNECAGHMMMNWDKNIYVNLSRRLKIDLQLEGRDEIFFSHNTMLKHYKDVQKNKVASMVQKKEAPVVVSRKKNTRRSDKSISGLHKMLYGAP